MWEGPVTQYQTNPPSGEGRVNNYVLITGFLVRSHDDICGDVMRERETDVGRIVSFDEEPSRISFGAGFNMYLFLGFSTACMFS